MAFEVEFADEFGAWWDGLRREEKDSIEAAVDVLAEYGPHLGRPHVDTLKGSKYPNMKELRVQHEGRPYRVFFAFDPRRMAMLLIGGDKTGDTRFYEEMIPKADAIYTQHLCEIEPEQNKRKG